MNEDNILDVEQPVETDNSVSESSEVSDSLSVEVEVLDEYTVENPLPVVLVEEEAVQEELEVYSLTGSYNGTISDTYLDYFEGIVQKLMPNEHYLIWRSGQYAYTMVYGEDISVDGNIFTGSGEVVEIYRSSDSYSSDWFVSTSSDTVDIDVSSLFCYSDLGMFPTVERGISSVESSALLFTVVLAFVFGIVSCIFNSIRR